jgi:beta and gamma crystallin|nr:MAG TPA: IrrE protein [Caudoviricetes sp.]
MRKTYEQLEAAANVTLKHFNPQDSQFTNVIAIAMALGYKVLATNFEKNISGMVVNNADGKYIYVNKNDTPERQRFTIAHEIGHILLHHVQKEEYFVDYRNNVKYDDREFEADNFAAALLMPREKSINVWYETEDVDDFAKAMKVSRAAASIRLINLGLIY